MAEAKSGALRDAIYNAVLRSTPYRGPAMLYMSLHTADPGLTGAHEIAGNGYARVSVAFGPPSPGTGAGANNGPVTFAPPGPADWGRPTHFGLWDAPRGGAFQSKGILEHPVTTSVGIRVHFGTGEVTWAET